MKLLLASLFACSAEAANSTRILILGDSWGTVSPATKHFQEELKEHDCPLDGFTNIAIGGTTAEQWSGESKMRQVKQQAALHDLIWVTLMGNDALAICPSCAKKGNSAEECGDELISKCTDYMTTIVDGIHEANPDAQVVGFGYDIMFGGIGCESITKDVFPQCWAKKSNDTNPIHCFNTQFIKLQKLWEDLAAAKPWVHAINILGTTQVAGGDEKAKIGAPDLDKFGPAHDWPLAKECIHPGTEGGDNSGAMLIMKQFYEQFWSKALAC